ncbi:hypothetical protein FOA52_015642 [Chlamydomonas sp. UWO 241]|nr:hypothetical protein FOA52_015642 [Chlamydomonas sp. UWO 241]
MVSQLARVMRRSSGARSSSSSSSTADAVSPQPPPLLLSLLPLVPPIAERLDAPKLSSLLSSLVWLGMPPRTAAPGEDDEGDSDGSRSGAEQASAAAEACGGSACMASAVEPAVTSLVACAAAALPGASPDDGVRILWAAAKLGALDGRLASAAADAALTGAWADVRGSVGGSGNGGGAVQAAAGMRVGPAFGVSLAGAAVPLHGVVGGFGGASPEGPLLPVRLLPTLLWALAHVTHPPQEPATPPLLPPQQQQAQQQPQQQQQLQLLMRHLLDPAAPLGTLANAATLRSLDTDGLCTCLYALGLRYGLPSGGTPCGDPSIGNVGGGGAGVPRATLDALCAAISERASTHAPVGGERCGGSEQRSRPLLPPRCASNAAWALSRLRHRHAPLLARAVASGEHWVGLACVAANATGAVPTADCGTAGAADGEGGSGSSGGGGDGRAGGRGFSPQELSNLMSALARLRVRPGGLLARVSTWLLQREWSSGGAGDGGVRLGARDASEVLYAYAAMKELPRDAACVEGGAQPPLGPGPGEHHRLLQGQQQQQQNHQARERQREEEQLHARASRALARAAGAHLHALGSEQLVGVAWAVARLRCDDGVSRVLPRVASSVLAQAQQAARQQGKQRKSQSAAQQQRGDGDGDASLLPVGTLGPEDVARLAWALAAAPPGVLPPELSTQRATLFSLLEAEAAEWASAMDDQALAMALGAFARARARCPVLLEAGCARASELLASGSLAPSRMPPLLWAVAALLRAPADGGDGGGLAGMAPLTLLRQAAAALSPRTVPSPPPGGGNMTIGTGGSGGDSSYAASALHSGGGRGAALLARAYATSGVQPGERLVGALASCLAASAQRLPPTGLAFAAWSLSRLRAPERAMREVGGAALGVVVAEAEAAERQAARDGSGGGAHGSGDGDRGDRALPARTLAALAVSLARARALSPQLHAALARCVFARARAGRGCGGAAEACQLLWSLSAGARPGAAYVDAELRGSVAALVACVARALLPPCRDAQAVGAAGSEEAVGEGDGVEPDLVRNRSGGSGAPLPGGLLVMWLSACADLGHYPGAACLDAASAQLSPQLASLSSHSLVEALAALAQLDAGRALDRAAEAARARGAVAAAHAQHAEQSAAAAVAAAQGAAQPGWQQEQEQQQHAADAGPEATGLGPAATAHGEAAARAAAARGYAAREAAAAAAQQAAQEAAAVSQQQAAAARAAALAVRPVPHERGTGSCGPLRRGPVYALASGIVRVLTERVVVSQQELLTLPVGVSLAWALAALEQLWWEREEEGAEGEGGDAGEAGSSEEEEGEGGVEEQEEGRARSGGGGGARPNGDGDGSRPADEGERTIQRAGRARVAARPEEQGEGQGASRDAGGQKQHRPPARARAPARPEREEELEEGRGLKEGQGARIDAGSGSADEGEQKRRIQARARAPHRPEEEGEEEGQGARSDAAGSGGSGGAAGTRHRARLVRAMPRLLVATASKVFACEPGALTGAPPALQARLHETVLALRARGVPRGSWRALAQRWRMRVEGGGPEGLPPGLLAQLQPPGVRQDEARAAAQVADSLRRLGLGGGAQWGVLPSGDALCTLDAWAGALMAQQPQQVQQAQQAQQTQQAQQAQQAQQQAPATVGQQQAGAVEGQQRQASARSPTAAAGAAPPLPLQRPQQAQQQQAQQRQQQQQAQQQHQQHQQHQQQQAQQQQRPQQQQQQQQHAQHAQQQQQSRRLALLLIGPRHASSNTTTPNNGAANTTTPNDGTANAHADHGTPRASLAPSALRCRALHAAGFRIVAVHVAEWLALGGALQQDAALRAGLLATLMLPAAAMVARPRGPPRRSRGKGAN